MEEFTGGGTPADGESIGSGASDDKSVNGERVRHRETNGDLTEEPRPNKGSRRTTSLLNLFIPLSQGDATTTRSPYSSISSWTAGFLRSRREKKDKKSKKKDSTNPSTGKEENKSDADEKDGGSHKSDTPTAEIDDEGYTVRPHTTFENDKGSFYSSSESDSDDDEREKRLRFEIKPSSNGGGPLSASVDELRSTVENMTLSPIGISGRKLLLHDAEATMKRSQSVSQRIGSSSPPSRHHYTPLSPPAPTNHRTNTKTILTDSSRYSDLADIFNEVGDIQPTVPAKVVGPFRNTPTPTSGLVAIPRPSSRPRPEGLMQRNLSSPSPAVSRTESIGSLDTRSIGSYVTGSRGPSPLTIGMSDLIPLAVAFHEIVHARFKGNDETLCQVKMTGDMMLSFPAGILHVFASNPIPSQLAFQVRTLQRLDNLIWNKELVEIQRDQDDLTVEFNMSALLVLLNKNSEQNPNASYFNVNILKYQITPKPGAGSCPLHLVAFWKRESSQVDLRIDYKCNSHAMAPSSQSAFPNMSMSMTSKNELPPLLQVCVAAHLDGGVKSMQSKPTGQWFPSTMRACWKIPSISCGAANQGVGTLRARFEVTTSQSSVGAIAAQFSCENSTLSGNEFYLIGSGYRVSLIKKCFVSGKYTCDAEESLKNAQSNMKSSVGQMPL